jgi:predicted NBD/HSP70 family sugar kinase
MAIAKHVKLHPGLARSDLAALTGLADSTVSVLVNGLIDDGWLMAIDGPAGGSGAGRRAKRLALNPHRLGLLGAEIGVDFLAVAACNLVGEVLYLRRIEYSHIDEARSIIDMAGLIALAHASLSKQQRTPLGLGIGLPGMVTMDGLLHFAPNLGWRDVPVSSQMAAALNDAGIEPLRATVLNDTNAMALGEYVFGASPPVSSLAYLNTGYGLGAGIVLNDRLVLGHEGFAGEVGHAILQPMALRCACGRFGCAETLLSQKGVSRLVTGMDNPALAVKELARRLEHGDLVVQDAARAAGEQLGLVIHNLIVTLNPAVVVLGGSLSQLPLFVDTALSSLRRLSNNASSHHADVRVSSFALNAGAIGAAAAVLHHLLHEPLDEPSKRGEVVPISAESA